MNEQELSKLIEKYLAGNCTTDEKKIVEDWYEKFEEKAVSPEFYGGQSSMMEESARRSKIAVDARLEQLKQKPRRIGVRLLQLVAAAACFSAIVIGIWKWNNVDDMGKQPMTVVQEDALPGGNNATLTLSNGNSIVLNNLPDGKIQADGNSTLDKSKGQLSYVIGSDDKRPVGYNTLTTPRGGQFHVVLPDGSGVWLNAATSLTYPTNFNGDTRTVKLSGEAYFEVAHDASKPFIVEAANTQTKVLGTHFNISAYSDASYIKTTLLQGKIAFTATGKQNILSPNQAATVRDGSVRVVMDNNAADAIAWKEGLFKLNSSDVTEILQQIARWYDVEIVYKGKTPEGHLSGEIPRNMNLSGVLKILELSGIHATIKNKQLLVSPD